MYIDCFIESIFLQKYKKTNFSYTSNTIITALLAILAFYFFTFRILLII